MKKIKFNWKPAAFLYGAILLAFIFCIAHIKHKKDFKVVHFARVDQTVGADGRYVAGSPEVYQVQISPALCWKLSKHGTGFWRAAGWVVILLIGVFIVLMA